MSGAESGGDAVMVTSEVIADDCSCSSIAGPSDWPMPMQLAMTWPPKLRASMKLRPSMPMKKPTIASEKIR